ncbi:MAG TPA: hypothetical protein VIY56_01545, partial [Vicinamibacterales bacterium]
ANFSDPANQGVAAGVCSLPAVGRLPWRTLGLDRLVDDAGEPLWYVVSSGWALPNTTTTLTINSDVAGQLSLDGSEAVALVIAPGRAVTVLAGGGCAAWTQSRPIAGTPDLRNYLECENANSPADANFVRRNANATFNDQVLRVAAADVMPALEAAIQDRLQREIAPALRTVYTNSSYSGIPSSSPMYPYAVPFGNPGTSTYQGASGIYQGLLPVNQASSMVAYASTPGAAVRTGSYGNINSQSCWWEVSNDIRVCEGIYQEDGTDPWQPIGIQLTATFTNVAMGLRAIDTARYQVLARDDGTGMAWIPLTANHQATMNSNGSVTLRFWATLPVINAMAWNTVAEFRLRIERAVIDDHPVVKTDDATFGWFTRNEWHRTLYYAVAQQNTAGVLPSLGCGNTTCLRFNEGLGCGGGANWCNIRALLVLGGGSLGNPPAARPNGNLADYFEYTNADGGTFYEQRPMRRASNVANPNGPWNDRVVLVDWPPSLPPLLTGTNPQVVSISPLRLRVLP